MHRVDSIDQVTQHALCKLDVYILDLIDFEQHRDCLDVGIAELSHGYIDDTRVKVGVTLLYGDIAGAQV